VAVARRNRLLWLLHYVFEYAFETLRLFEQGQWLLMGLNVITSNVLCLISVLAGAALARWL